MNVVKMVTPLLSLFNIGQRFAPIETRPALPEWRPAGGDIVPVPGQKIERVIRRVKQDGNVTIYEEEVIFIREPVAVVEPERPYTFETCYGAPTLTPGEIAQVVADWHAGKAQWIGGPPDPDRALRDAFAPQRHQAVVRDGRIVLQE